MNTIRPLAVLDDHGIKQTYISKIENFTHLIKE